MTQGYRELLLRVLPSDRLQGRLQRTLKLVTEMMLFGTSGLRRFEQRPRVDPL